MSVKKILSESPENNFGLVDFIKLVYPTAKSKYYNMITNLIKKDSLNDEELVKEEKSLIKQIFPDANPEDLDKLSNFQLYMAFRLTTGLYETRDEWEYLSKFIEYNELGLIENNDVTSYKSIEQIKDVVTKAQVRKIEKELESQVLKVYDDNEWLAFRPLSYSASVKYGYGTKWCTAMDRDSDYFQRYTQNGILIYCVNRTSTKKVAFYTDVRPDHPNNLEHRYQSISFWNEKDESIDSLFTGLPVGVLKAIKNEIDNNYQCNRMFFSKEELERTSNKEKNFKKSISDTLSVSIPVGEINVPFSVHSHQAGMMVGSVDLAESPSVSNFNGYVSSGSIPDMGDCISESTDEYDDSDAKDDVSEMFESESKSERDEDYKYGSIPQQLITKNDNHESGHITVYKNRLG